MKIAADSGKMSRKKSLPLRSVDVGSLLFGAIAILRTLFCRNMTALARELPSLVSV